MERNFIIKKGEGLFSIILVVGYFLFTDLYVRTESLIVLPAMLLCAVALLMNIIMYFRWTFSFAIFVDTEKKEVVLNHALFFRKKKISLEDIKEIDIQKGNIILLDPHLLSKMQRILCKKSGDYIISLKIIHPCERKQLLELLLRLKQ